MRLNWFSDKPLRDALQRLKSAKQQFDQASLEAQKKRDEEATAADELRCALEEIVGRIRGKQPNGSS